MISATTFILSNTMIKLILSTADTIFRRLQLSLAERLISTVFNSHASRKSRRRMLQPSHIRRDQQEVACSTHCFRFLRWPTVLGLPAWMKCSIPFR
ncbi:hypothetical protein AXF42_Ash000726 [Apostasia shenzhenica]|uniref:Uncharacterized protein n=1 Tax=Apostasia shenzhenica TaxID=1088818 RepID=A0A2I0AH58_9ASPA|nr:hypothetical protein AXF42_Ash000726 [Apostasia shenzhenica]